MNRRGKTSRKTTPKVRNGAVQKKSVGGGLVVIHPAAAK